MEERKVSLRSRFIGLCILLIGCFFIIGYASEYMLDKLQYLESRIGQSYHYDWLVSLLDTFLGAKNFIIHDIGLGWLISGTLVALIVLAVLIRKITKIYYYKLLPLFFGNTFESDSEEFDYMSFKLQDYLAKKRDDESRGKSEIKNIEARYENIRALFKRKFYFVSKIPLLRSIYQKVLRLIKHREEKDLEKHARNSLYKRTFLGLTSKGKPFSLNEDQRTKHLEVIGKSGTGKTKSVLVPIALQDMMVGKSVIIVNGKGDETFPSLAYVSAKATGREDAFYILNIAFPDNSHTYNPVYLGKYGDPAVVADRMFSVLGYQNEYYSDIALNFFTHLVCILAGTGKAFNLQDLYMCVCSDEALDYVCKMSSAKRSIKLLELSIKRIKMQREDVLSGLKTKLELYRHDILNAYNPDIIIEDILEKDQIVFLSLNINMMPNLAPAVARLFLREVQQNIGGREADLKRNQNPCSIILDEFSTFIYKHFHVAISQFREGKAQLTFAHQSGCDLNLCDKELGSVVWDNAQTKIVLAQDDSIQCQKIAEMVGTQKVVERTERYNKGLLFLRKPTFESSNKYVNEFLFHPNKLKKLEPCGQGYVLTTKAKSNGSERTKSDMFHPEADEREILRITGVNLGMLPDEYRIIPKIKRKPPVEGLNLTKMFLDKEEDTVKGDNEINKDGETEPWV